MRLFLVAESAPNRDVVAGDGSSMISFELVMGLPADVEIELVTFESELPLPPEVVARCSRVHMLTCRGWRAALLRSVISPWEVGGCQRATTAAKQLVRALSARADVTLLHGPHVACLSTVVAGPAVLQVVDPWSLRTRMEASMAQGGRRVFLGLRVRRLESAERSLRAGLRLLTVGQQDAESWERLLRRPVRAVPNGVAVQRCDIVPGPVPTLCFAGSLDYGPNIDSARRLVESVAPKVWAQLPSARVVLAGRRPVADVLALQGDRVEVRGDVASLQAELAGSHVAVFADRFGVGERNTVREALAGGVPVVATAVAARGLVSLRGVTLGETDEELAAAVVNILRRPGARAVPDQGAPATGTWEEMVQTYLQVLDEAIRSHPDRQQSVG